MNYMLVIRICSILEALLVIIAIICSYDLQAHLACFCIIYISRNVIEIMEDKDG